MKDLEILVVDDCSTDGTTQLLDSLPPSPDLRIFHHPVNQGKGAGIRTAQANVTGDVVIIQDADLEYSPNEFPAMLKPIADNKAADLEYSPNEFPAMLKPIADNKADAVFGSRYSGREILVDSFWHYCGNKFLTFVSNVFSNLHLTDMETCYKMIRADIFKSFTLECNRFGFEPEITAKHHATFRHHPSLQ